jgi:N-acetylglucosaminyl-diphospho-decaprenol L-rhamnosyltransferase
MTPIVPTAVSEGRSIFHEVGISNRPATPPVVSVVIVNYCQWRNTARLVRQLMASVAFRRGQVEIVVVDNHSPFHPLRRRLRRTAGVSLRCLRRNYGFAGGVNEACRLSRGRWFLLINPDVTVSPGWLDRLLATVDDEKMSRHTGAIGFQLRDSNCALQGSVGSYPTLLSTLVGQLRPRSVRKCRTWLGRSGEVSWVTGCGLLLRRECFEQIGGFDRAFFLYYEDADFCKRARAAGWSVRHEPALSIEHHHPLHQRQLSPRMRLLTRHSLMVYAGKHWGGWSCLMLAAIVWLESALRGRLTQNPGSRAKFRTIRASALDFALGRQRQAYRRAWRAAQVRRRSEFDGQRRGDLNPRRQRHERRPLPN